MPFLCGVFSNGAQIGCCGDERCSSGMNYSFSISSRLKPVPSAILSISKPKRLKAAAVSSAFWREPSSSASIITVSCAISRA